MSSGDPTDRPTDLAQRIERPRRQLAQRARDRVERRLGLGLRGRRVRLGVVRLHLGGANTAQ